MTQLKTYDSSRITWTIYPGDSGCNIRSFCADGDGIVAVEQLADDVYVLCDQGDHLESWTGVQTSEQLAGILENAQTYLQANYPEIYEDAMHWNEGKS